MLLKWWGCSYVFIVSTWSNASRAEVDLISDVELNDLLNYNDLMAHKCHVIQTGTSREGFNFINKSFIVADIIV